MDGFRNINIRNKMLVAAGIPGAGAVAAGMMCGDTMAMGMGFAAAVVGLFLANIIGGQLEESIRSSIDVISDIANGEYKTKGAVSSQDEVGRMAYALGNLQTALAAQNSIEQEPTTNDSDERLLKSLNLCNASVLVADETNSIVYMNDSINEMFKEIEVDLKKLLPQFNRDTLIGTNMDIFHKDVSHQRHILKNLTSEHRVVLELGEMHVQLILNPLKDEAGNRIGTVLEWENQTAAVKAKEDEQRVAAENSRIRLALDVCDTSVMMADEDLNIIYMNEAVTKMMTSRERTIQTELPNFSAKDLMGFNVDDFHKNPAHQRGMLKELRQPYKTCLPIAGLNFNLIATPLYDDSGVRLGTVVEWADVTERLAKEQEDATVAAENSRVRQALDRVAANTMIADADFNIIYMNDAIEGMFRIAESDLRQDLPNFSANQLMGTNIDGFHKNPSHQRSMVGGLTGTFNGEIKVGGRTFGLIANPIVNDEGARLGTVVEWNDRTAEVAIEKEIDVLVEAAGAGDFTKQIDLNGKEGFFKKLSQGLNTLVETTEVGLNDVIRVLGAMAQGDLTERITRDYGGSFAQLKDDVNTTEEKLTEVIKGIQEAAGAVTSGANEITSGNADLSQRTEEQASSLEETASSMEEMTSAVRASADNATKASDESKSTADIAGKGGKVVQQAVTAMEEINKSSKQIADIIGVIDEIAFQTNLLALNAAVEAARAGEQGRGFAVVAGEVRNLAQRSAEAAREIKDLIRDSVEKVDDGTQLVNESGETLQQIVDAVTNVSTMIQDINSAAIEQTSGIEQVNTAISQMDEMTQQNAALVEEASAAGEAMSEQASRMSDMVGFFNIGDGAGGGGLNSYSASVRAVTPSNAVSTPSGHSVADDDEWEEF